METRPRGSETTGANTKTQCEDMQRNGPERRTEAARRNTVEKTVPDEQEDGQRGGQGQRNDPEGHKRRAMQKGEDKAEHCRGDTEEQH